MSSSSKGLDGVQKMSKSLGNFFTIPDLLAKGFKGEAVRLAMLETHYRAPLDLTEAKIRAAQNRLDGLYRQMQGGKDFGAPDLSGLMDDLHTSEALKNPANFASLGLLQMEPSAWFKGELSDEDARIDKLIEERAAAKVAKDFVRADAIRDQLTAQGVMLEDAAGSSTWRR